MRFLAVGFPDIGVTNISGKQGATFVCDLCRNLQCTSIQRFEQVFLADDAKFLTVSVIGERLDDIGAGMYELAVKLQDFLRVLEDYFRYKRTGLYVAPALQFKQIAFGTDYRTGFKPLEKSGCAWISCRHVFPCGIN